MPCTVFPETRQLPWFKVIRVLMTWRDDNKVEPAAMREASLIDSCVARCAVFAGLLLAPLALLPGPATAGYSESSSSDDLGRYYSLTGSLELSYDRLWSHAGTSTADFRQLLLLDHRGFMVDPELVTYEVAGRVAHDAGSGIDNSTLLGTDLAVTLFRSLPAGLREHSDYIPHPIWLRFTRETENGSDYTSYGLSFSHAMAKKHRYLEVEDPFKNGDKEAKAGEEEGAAGKKASSAAEGDSGDLKTSATDAKSAGKRKDDDDSDLYDDGPSKNYKVVEKDGIPFPVTFFDYDHYDQKSSGSRTVNDLVSLRSALTGKTYEYRLLFEKQNEGGSVQLQRTLLQLEPIYHFNNEETRRQIEVRNVAKYEDYNGDQNVNLGNTSTLSKPLGKDLLLLSSQTEYSGTSGARLSETRYDGQVSANYQKFLAQRMNNSTTVTASFKKDSSVDKSALIDQDKNFDYHSERITDTVTADLSQLYNGLATAYLGNGVQGIEYGASATVTSKTRISTFATYSYDLAVSQAPVTTISAQPTTPPLYSNEKVSKHDVTIGATGPLLNNLAFQTRAEFVLREPVTGYARSEQDELLSGNLLWRLPRTSLAVGGNYNQIKKEGSPDASSATIFANLTRVMPMRMLFNLYSTWTKTDDGIPFNGAPTRLEIRPSLRWTRGLTTLDTEYSYTRSTSGGESSVDQRFFARLVRKFSALF